ncbi:MULTISPECIES: hypothetical protein [Heyndrickxia]|uniref:hypothetical protein n=1 Tax=Heyndrickxia TaxID=2837504 RepID=UPI00054CF2CF|nr:MULTISPECIES: hypothetical protein [Heyndrickxia]KGT37322.1 hypothetical protein P421_15970 [Heyndrickxia coagulans P38]MBF8417535.1 hypothetical protein [Heyndrickxia coagulans]MED4320270.1 hypothetical protein [Weizmannia sp. CD-2023]MED4345407.1 hypothetical protein [Heyndrickxia coagulans]MED4841947.1 hypothetical protein [Weizmannia sp. CD-2023]
MSIEEELEKYNQLKIDLLKMSKCIEDCDISQKELYQNICLEYSKELKNAKNALASKYGIKACQCCNLP